MNSAERQVHDVQGKFDVAMKTVLNSSISPVCHHPAAIHGDFLPIRSITYFEHLSNEILFDIFDFLNGYDILEAFSNLNIRFEHLFRCSYFTFKLTIPFMSKSNFKKRSTNIIAPHIHQIISLHLSEVFFIKYFFTSFPIDLSFIRLESLTLDGLDPDSATFVLTSLALLPRLFSLTIIFDSYPKEDGDIYPLIFRLPVLTFAKLLFEDCSNEILSFPVATSIHQQSTTLEHLVIDNLSSPASIHTLLSYTPRLRRLSAHWLAFNVRLPRGQPIGPLSLTHLSLNRCHLSLDDFESFIATIGSQLEVLRVSMDNNTTSLNADRWQQLILRHIPRLRTFVFDYFGPMIRDANGNITCRTLLDRFSSSFWIERQWFFGHRHDQFSEWHSSLAFYSTQSRWRHSCRVNVFLHDHICPYQDMIFHLAFTRHVYMKSEHVVADAPFQFPHATELILTGNYTINIHSFIDNLSRIFHLKNITHLEISRNDQGLDIVTILLGHMPNVHTLVLERILLSKIHFLLDKQVNNLDLVYNNNVTNVTINHALTLDAARLLNNLFPRMECLDIRYTRENLISIIRTLLSNRINNSRLFSLVVYNRHETIEQLKAMIDCEKLLDDYQIERLSFRSHVWW